MIFKVECSMGHSYTQETDDKRQIIRCGSCGTAVVRVWKLQYDSWTPQLPRTRQVWDGKHTGGGTFERGE